MSRPYRIIQGICYPHLISGSNKTKKITANLNDPEAFYYDESIRLAEDDLNGFKGKPICFDHDESIVIGEITHVWKDSDNHMRMTGRVYTDTDEGIQMFNNINNRVTSSLSVGYSVEFDKSKNVEKKKFSEISVCERPFFKGACISVAASDKKKYITNATEKGKLNFQIMAELNQTTPLDSANKDSSELARVHDDLLKKTEEQQKKLSEFEAMKEQLAALQAEKLQQRNEYAESQKPKLKEVLDLTEQQFKEQNGADAVLPAEYKQSVENAFLMPEGKQAAAVITASALSWKKQRDERAAMEARFAELEAKNKKLLSDQEVAMAHVKASERLHLSTETISAKPTTESVSVTAKGGFNMSNLFVPSDWEKTLYKEATGRDAPAVSSVSVTASSLTLPQHNFKDFVPNSLSNGDGRVNFAWLFNNEAGFNKFSSNRFTVVPEKTQRTDY